MTEDEKFEERVREIVRDELQAEWLEVKGYADQAREMCFSMTRAIIEQCCKNVLNSFNPKRGGTADDQSGER